ncbi:MAG TPA: competence/damage-inducible protein A [Sedimentisphaerales bacterium]|nr:competence/damage-inducible protein A [Sedimentisphaerales bacterium]
MKRASIVSIGNELLSGQTVDTNAAFLSQQLLSIGIPVVSSYTVGDDTDSIVRLFNLASSDADLILATGGLGPTDDDLTRQAFAKFLGSELQLQKELLEKIQDFFTSRNRQMSSTNKIQAYIPAGAKALANNLGTAPGIMAEVEGKLLFALPGVPSEMRQMFEESVLPELHGLAGRQAIVIRKLRCFGTGESNIAELLSPLMERGRNPLINSTASRGVITLTITGTAENKDTAEQMAEKDEKFLRNKLGELVYGTGEQTLAEVVGEKLARQNKTIAVAESCTGGCLAKLLTDIPGASRYFTYGWFTYSNSAKTSEVGVPAHLIEKHGAVSKQVAQAMAQGARKKAGTTFAIGITGIAGPAGASEQKPVGLVYISIDSDNRCETKRFVFSGGRDTIRLRTAQTALNMLRLKLQD